MHLNSESPLSPIVLIVSVTLSQPLLSTSPSHYLPARVVRWHIGRSGRRNGKYRGWNSGHTRWNTTLQWLLLMVWNVICITMESSLRLLWTSCLINIISGICRFKIDSANYNLSDLDSADGLSNKSNRPGNRRIPGRFDLFESKSERL